MPQAVALCGASTSPRLKGRCTVLTCCPHAMSPCRCLFICPPMVMAQLQVLKPPSPPCPLVNLSGRLTGPV